MDMRYRVDLSEAERAELTTLLKGGKHAAREIKRAQILLAADAGARDEDVLDLYAEPSDPKRPVVCFDESPTQLIGEVREPIPAAPGQPERCDYDYRRNGTANFSNETSIPA